MIYIMASNETGTEIHYLMIRRMDIILLTVHSFFLILFFILKIKIAAVFNIFSVLWYIILFFLTKKHLTITNASWLMISEIWVHLVIVILCIGWDAGFQLYCIGLVSILFSVAYHTNHNSKKLFHPVLASIISMITFFAMRFWTLAFEPLYTVTKTMTTFMYTMNALLIFFLVIFVSKQYSDIVYSSEQFFIKEANFDELTHLYNRRKMREILGTTQELAQRTGTKYCITMFDIDDFKKTNDTYGHDTGDYVLIIIGEILVSHATDTAKVCRWGGEEFLMTETYTGSITPCIKRIEDIREEVENYPFTYRNDSFRITITAGAAHSEPGLSIARLIATADEKLYIGKETGKNKIIL